MPDDRQVRVMEVSLRELLYFLDSVGNADLDQGDEEQPMRVQALARPLLRKLMSLYLDLVPSSGLQPTMYATTGLVTVTEREAWLLRGRVTFGAMGLDKVMIGPALLYKLFVLLLSFCDDIGLRPPGDPGLGEVDGLKRLDQFFHEHHFPRDDDDAYAAGRV